MNILSRHILEIRNDPYFNFLDKKGSIADKIKGISQFEFNYWKYTDNSVDFFDSKNKVKIFVSLNNFGVVVENPKSQLSFFDNAKLILQILLDDENFGDRDIIRIGCRSLYLIDNGDNFANLKEKYLEKAISINPSLLNIFGGDLVDIGMPINFEDKKLKIKYNIVSGPMQRKQMNQFFDDNNIYSDSLFPENALYFETDYFSIERKRRNKNELINEISGYINSSSSIYKTFKEYMFN
jgi:hypothetical protein